jgi:secreted trypsin-like serine protease
VRKLCSIIAPAFAALAVIAVPALAITGGQADGAAHPSVGLVASLDANGTRTPLCSSVLVAPTVVVTAAHCFAADGERVAVSFDPVVDPAHSTFVSGRAVVDPGFGLDRNDSHDIAVVLLDAPVAIAPARLPAAGNAAGLSKKQDIVNVGYGYESAANPVYDGVRRWSTSTLAKVGSTTITLKLKTGGVCFGDSGGPHFSGGTIAAIVSTGNRKCSGSADGYRLDSPSARAFLAPYVALP